jgi:hypothetical protein
MTEVSTQERVQSAHNATAQPDEPPSERDLRSDPTPAPDPSPVPDPNVPPGPSGPEPLPGVIPPRPAPAGNESPAAR